MASSIRLACMSVVRTQCGSVPSLSRLCVRQSLRSTLPVCGVCVSQQQQSSSVAAQGDKPGLWTRLKEEMGFSGKLLVPKRALVLSGYNMYLCCTELVDFRQMVDELDLPDTFNSFFLVVSLHVWLCMVRLTQLGREGAVLRNNLVQAMWTDLDKRSKQLGENAGSSKRREGIRTMGDTFYASLFAFDEGLLLDDKAMAGAVWRTLFEMREVEADKLELMVEYIRKQVQHIDQQDGAAIMGKGLVTFLPLHGDKEDVEHNKRILKSIYNRPVYL